MKKKITFPIALDIETIPDEEKFDMLPDPEPSGRLRDPEKIEADLQAKRQEQFQNMALSPFTGRICAFAFANDYVSFSDHLRDVTEKSEIALLGHIREIIQGTRKTLAEVVTFNGMAFDLPYIYGRMMCLGMAIPFMPLSYWCKRYTNKPHCDLRMLLGNWDSRVKGSLDFYGKMLLDEEKDEPDYSEFLDLIKKGKGRVISDSCEQHTQLTWDIFKKVKAYYL